MLEINQVINEGITVTSFESRGCEYTVFQNPKNDYIEVWSERGRIYGAGRQGPKIALYSNFEELAKRSKVFKNLVVLLEEKLVALPETMI